MDHSNLSLFSSTQTIAVIFFSLWPVLSCEFWENSYHVIFIFTRRLEIGQSYDLLRNIGLRVL